MPSYEGDDRALFLVFFLSLLSRWLSNRRMDRRNYTRCFNTSAVANAFRRASSRFHRFRYSRGQKRSSTRALSPLERGRKNRNESQARTHKRFNLYTHLFLLSSVCLFLKWASLCLRIRCLTSTALSDYFRCRSYFLLVYYTISLSLSLSLVIYLIFEVTRSR